MGAALVYPLVSFKSFFLVSCLALLESATRTRHATSLVYSYLRGSKQHVGIAGNWLVCRMLAANQHHMGCNSDGMATGSHDLSCLDSTDAGASTATSHLLS